LNTGLIKQYLMQSTISRAPHIACSQQQGQGEHEHCLCASK